MARKVTLLKLGGSVITDKTRPFTARKDEIQRLAREIQNAIPRRQSGLIVVHGGGSFPHTPAAEYRVHEGAKKGRFRGFVMVQQAAADLNRIVVREFVQVGVNAWGVQPSVGAIARRSRIIRWDIGAFRKALENDILPVTYGDVGFDLGQGCSILSGEEIIRYLATKLPVDRVIVGSDVNGLFLQDPKSNPQAEKVALVTKRNFREVMNYARGSGGIDVTGGMQLKIRLLLEIVTRHRQIECEIANISQAGTLESLLLGKRGLGTVVRYV
jgi:isopentenyl phosphate kinase